MKYQSLVQTVFGACLFCGMAAAQAQSNACVYLEPGSGYAAEMRVSAGGMSTPWSSSFPIGKSACQSLKQVGDGGEYTVELKAVLGKTVTCSPTLKRNVDYQGSVVYQASGTTLNVHCQMLGAQK